jgi:hypothetical protein
MPAQNLAVSTVASAPSPATSGTTVTIATGHGAWFADPATAGVYPVSIWPAGVLPDRDNTEIATVTALAGDVLTVVRAQEGTTARTVTVGDQVAATETAATVGARHNLTLATLYTNGIGR